MPVDLQEPRRSDHGIPLRPSHAFFSATLGIGCGVCCSLLGCANPGPAKPPSLHLPTVVKDLAAQRSGDHVHLRWTTPSRTTDDMDVKGSMIAEICREVGVRPAAPAARAASCAPVRRIAATPGASEADDTLPPNLQAEPVLLLTYRVQIFNSTGHSAGESLGAFTAAGPVPPQVESLRATAADRGVVLEWHPATAPSSASAVTNGFVDLWRTDLSTPTAPKQSHPNPSAVPGEPKPVNPKKTSGATPDQMHLRAIESATGSPGTVDTTAKPGDTYSYIAERVRRVTLANHTLELRSAPSQSVTLAVQDTFPPKIPTGLATISGLAKPQTDSKNAGNTASAPPSVPYVDLSWEPNGEPDLVGYRVYRQLATPDGSPQGPLARLTPLPLTAPSYRDVAVRAGQGYIYTVTAVDAAGNESAPSAKALELVPAEIGEPSSP